MDECQRTINGLKKELEARQKRISELMERAEQCDRAVGACRIAEDELQKERGLLESRVRQRTLELTSSNQALREEIAERAQVEKTLAESEAKYREVVQHANSVILRMDPRGNVIFMNDFGLRFFGYTDEEILGRNVIGTIVPATSTSGRDLAAMILDIGKRPERYVSNENENMRRDGERVWVAWTNRAILDNEGRIVEILCIGNDITALKMAEEALLKARDELERRVEERTVELSNMNLALEAEIRDRVQAERELRDAKEQAELYVDLIAHDINNFNQVAMGYLELARDSLRLDKEALVFVQKPLDMLARSSDLIRNVRKLQQVKRGGLPAERIDLGPLLDELVRRYSMCSGREIRIHHVPVQGAYVMANELLKDVFENMIGNSIKHSTGAIDIYVDVSRTKAGDKEYYRIAIGDTGPGIPDDLKARLFAHERADRPYGRGLGLFLVRNLVDSFHGSVSVEDRVPGEPAKGARFIVMLPAAPAR